MRNESRKAVIVGPYRVHNFGDDLVGAIIAKHMQSVGYEVTIPLMEKHNADWLGTEYAEGYDKPIANADTIVVGGGGIMSDTSGSKPGASYLDIVARRAISGQ
jgi:polysaccharide pyruvyl transferase WcaK-like protein